MNRYWTTTKASGPNAALAEQTVIDHLKTFKTEGIKNYVGSYVDETSIAGKDADNVAEMLRQNGGPFFHDWDRGEAAIETVTRISRQFPDVTFELTVKDEDGWDCTSITVKNGLTANWSELADREDEKLFAEKDALDPEAAEVDDGVTEHPEGCECYECVERRSGYYDEYDYDDREDANHPYTLNMEGENFATPEEDAAINAVGTKGTYDCDKCHPFRCICDPDNLIDAEAADAPTPCKTSGEK